MKYIASILLASFLVDGLSGHATQLDTQVYSFRVTGKVVFKKLQSPPGATVYVMGTGPLSGRIPWVHANKDGTFAITFSDRPDLYRVFAHPGETNGLLPLARTPEEAKKMPIKLSCTKHFPLDARHLDEHVQLKLK
ncbi:MAG TPA: hypothetical protein VGJ48_03480 [Pyrinomonadaceae bacterium]|jgi:hypothetical protein